MLHSPGRRIEKADKDLKELVSYILLFPKQKITEIYKKMEFFSAVNTDTNKMF